MGVLRGQTDSHATDGRLHSESQSSCVPQKWTGFLRPAATLVLLPFFFFNLPQTCSIEESCACFDQPILPCSTIRRRKRTKTPRRSTPSPRVAPQSTFCDHTWWEDGRVSSATTRLNATGLTVTLLATFMLRRHPFILVSRRLCCKSAGPRARSICVTDPFIALPTRSAARRPLRPSLRCQTRHISGTIQAPAPFA